ncbi:hypothetical protein FRC10_003954 [Ceratobasidium sp. 414]|nr:hypothetical protein FRC10_003954 [Ceratobasidium sp. 414]
MSHPTGSGNGLVYDEKLLDQAPQVTKGQRQEGYDADILNPAPPPASRSPPLDYNERNADVESGASPNEKHLAAGGYDLVNHSGDKPFWKTTKGLIIIAVVALVVIAAAVGGGVGGSVGKNKSNNAVVPASTNNTNSTMSVASTASATPDATHGEQVPTTSSACRRPDCTTRTFGASPTSGGVSPGTSTPPGEVPGQPATTTAVFPSPSPTTVNGSADT